ncbi:ATPase family gene 2 protein homolog B-like [Lycorma delicatula]|uniref:ATPase family gene 2 protein homolog B-like n=1 Tax=Lycorma delicatula TaxID=130591 RepID=UPI003F50FDD7
MLKVINNTSFFSLQKLFVSTQLNIQPGQFVLVNINVSVYIICRLCAKRDLHPSYCILNKSVVYLKDIGKLQIFRGKIDTHTDCKYISCKNLTIIDSIHNLKNVIVSLVFENANLTAKWRLKTSTLRLIIKEVLKTLVVSSDTVVLPGCITACQKLGIYCIIVSKTDFDYGKVISSTSISIDHVISKNWFESNRVVPNIGGVETIYSALKEYCILESKRFNSCFSSQFNNNVLLSGPSGCGKTTMVLHLASDCGFPLLSIIGPELSNPQPGTTEKALKKIFEEAKLLASEKPNGICILLLDQVECLSSKKPASHLARIQSTLIHLLDSLINSPGVFVVATTDRSDMLSPALRRPPRFTSELMMGVPTESERQSMLSIMSKECGLDVCIDTCNEVAHLTPGYVAADLELLVSDTVREILKKASNLRNENNLDIWRLCVLRMRPSTLRGGLGIVSNSDVKISDLGGMSHPKRILTRAIEWPFLYKDALKRFGIPPTKGILLYGPPGCAKTSLVRAVASGNNVTFLAVSAASLYSPYVGDAERTVSQLFHRARLSAPAILFIDEIDGLVGCRGDDAREKGANERILSSFLIEMDGIGTKAQRSHSTNEEIIEPLVIVIGATNQPRLLDSALLRPGRFDHLIYIGPPDRNERHEILLKLTKKIPLGSSVDLECIADKTLLYSGADLAILSKEAALTAMIEEGMNVEKIEQKHWLHALENMKPSLSQQQIDFYKNFSF